MSTVTLPTQATPRIVHTGILNLGRVQVKVYGVSETPIDASLMTQCEELISRELHAVHFETTGVAIIRKAATAVTIMIGWWPRTRGMKVKSVTLRLPPRGDVSFRSEWATLGMEETQILATEQIWHCAMGHQPELYLQQWLTNLSF